MTNVATKAPATSNIVTIAGPRYFAGVTHERLRGSCSMYTSMIIGTETDSTEQTIPINAGPSAGRLREWRRLTIALSRGAHASRRRRLQRKVRPLHSAISAVALCAIRNFHENRGLPGVFLEDLHSDHASGIRIVKDSHHRPDLVATLVARPDSVPVQVEKR